MPRAMVAIVSGAAADMVDVSTRNGQVLESGPAGSLLQACGHIIGTPFENVFFVQWTTVALSLKSLLYPVHDYQARP